MNLVSLQRISFRILSYFGALAMSFTLVSCESDNQPDHVIYDSQSLGFPSFITPVESYFRESIGEAPVINEDSYKLTISGAVLNPASYSLEELRNMEMNEKTLTVECIGNPGNGPLLGNATWKGFNLYTLLSSLGIKEGASIVKYICADGYYTYNTLDEIQNTDVIAALYMNEETIPVIQGFPLRIIFPGYYGVRHPGWIVEIELLENMEEDYWQSFGWKSDTSMTIDSKIFFPANHSKFPLGDSIRIGGAAFGSKRISSVDISVDDGLTWTPASIVQNMEEDYTWVFWEVYIRPQTAGMLAIRSRATDQNNNIQPRNDNNYLDGTNSWPLLNIYLD